MILHHLKECAAGDFHLLRADLCMDVGQSLNPAIDIGQVLINMCYTTLQSALQKRSNL